MDIIGVFIPVKPPHIETIQAALSDISGRNMLIPWFGARGLVNKLTLDATGPISQDGVFKKIPTEDYVEINGTSA